VVWLAPLEDKATVALNQVRELNEQVGYRPFEAKSRVVIVDNAADVLLPPSQNALLKTLEEPPSGTVFVLVTSQPEGLLATVRSRCPSVRFGPLPAADVAACLERDHGVGPADARAQAAVSDGSVGVALGAAAMAGARTGVERVLSLVARARDPRSRLDVAKEIVGKASKGSGLGERDSLAVHLRLLHGLLRDLGILSTRSDAGALANADLEPLLQGLVPAFDRARLVRAFTAVDRALGALDRNASPKIVADWLVLQL
jgi:DNA polymerase-3 subunit delta'